jgi:hypothetical protein
MKETRRRRSLVLGALVAGAVALLAATREPKAVEAARGHDRRAPGAPLARPPAPRIGRAELLRLLAAARTLPAQDRAHERPADGLPHPLTPQHLRLYRDVDLLRAADAEIKAGRFDAARALIAQHRRELAGMSAPEEEGLLLLADCAEQRSAGNVARVQRFYDAHTDSMLRRRLRRACLEARDSVQ